MTQQPCSGCLRKKVENVYLHTYIHCNVVHTGQEMETMKCPLIDDYMTKCGSDIQGNTAQP